MKYLFLTALLTVVCTELIPKGKYTDCGTPQRGTILSVDISPCPHIPCILKLNSTTSISVDFISHVNTTKVKTIVHAIISGGILDAFLHLVHLENEGIRFLGLTEDACLGNNVDHCNITAGEKIHYTNSLFINPDYPKLRPTIRWEIKDEHDMDLVCIELTAEIM